MILNASILKALYPQIKKDTFLLAVSGGVDSIVLSDLFLKSKLKFSIAHCNFKLRSKESEKDKRFVKKLAKHINVKFYSKDFETEYYAKTNKCSIQMAARDLRYEWFFQLIDEENINYLVTAHHLDDQIETFLINTSRGTGIEGLLGIRETNNLLRPLLKFTKKEILNYAKDNKLNWREDQSNFKNTYLRNSIRNKVVDELENHIPELKKNFSKTLDQLNLAYSLIKDQVQLFKKEKFIDSDDETKILISDIIKLRPLELFLYSVFKEYGFNHPKELIKLINSVTGRIISSNKYELLKNREHLILKKKLQIDNSFYNLKIEPHKLINPINIEISFKPFVTKTNFIELDYSSLSCPLIIQRPWRGAYFFPNGMKGKKKISKYFKDEKLSSFDKKNQWLLTSNDEVVWVIGMRLDRRFVATKKSKKRVYIRTN